MTETIKLIVAPAEDSISPETFVGKVGDLVVSRSRQPFLDAARELINLGKDPDSILEMYHEGSTILALRSKLGVAATLSVKETSIGKPVFCKFRSRPKFWQSTKDD